MTNEQVRLTRPIGGSTIPDRAEVAQLVEHLTENQGVTSSILVLGTSRILYMVLFETSSRGEPSTNSSMSFFSLTKYTDFKKAITCQY